MAFIVKSQGDNPGYSLTYEELAQLWNGHVRGNPAASIALGKLPDSERRLAEGLYKAYTPNPKGKGRKKDKKRSKALTKARSGNDARTSQLYSLLNHPDPWCRETARAELEKS